MPEPDNRQHHADVFDVDDKVPWFEDWATVLEREVHDEWPDEMDGDLLPPSHSPPARKDDVPYVILRLGLPEKADAEEILYPASTLLWNTKESFSHFGLPDVRGQAAVPVGQSRTVTVSVPSTGSDHLTAQQARKLADHLRLNDDFEPLRVLLAGATDKDEVHRFADALDRAATAVEIGERQD